ncbi:hypothetical protein ZEROTOHERO_82 [Citrobacter phage vB_CfrD_ZerotoHero]|uniref:Uncharacterized protein n=1 Tax=Citrobacter phage vB_CfrD_ZerotoHero TaxID=2777372 RepID=A0A7T3TLJ6_9CAUD|nr:hypothetical protein ZEROTOHERO_82 [Citrobacter phage vB_CfrD_ZerotoHero]
MIKINLSEEQAKSLLNSLGWRYGSCEYERLDVKSDVAKEVFIQLEQQLMPRSTSAAELAVWRHENGLNEMDVEKWKRKNGKAVDKVGFVGRCIMVNVEKFR